MGAGRRNKPAQHGGGQRAVAWINGAGPFMWKTTIERQGGLDNHVDIILSL
jgi:hypothetical protein